MVQWDTSYIIGMKNIGGEMLYNGSISMSRIELNVKFVYLWSVFHRHTGPCPQL